MSNQNAAFNFKLRLIEIINIDYTRLLYQPTIIVNSDLAIYYNSAIQLQLTFINVVEFSIHDSPHCEEKYNIGRYPSTILPCTFVIITPPLRPQHIY